MGRTSRAREKLLDSAVELMYRRSYANVGVQELCEHAGVKKGSFYHFFPSKRDLTVAALEHVAQRIQSTVFTPALASSRPPIQKLEQWVTRVYREASSVKQRIGHVLGCPIGNLAAELSAQEEVIRQKVLAIFAGFTRQLEAVIREAVTTESIPRQNAAQTAQALWAYIEGLHLLAKATNDPAIIRRLGHEYVRRLIGRNADKTTDIEAR